MEIVGGIVDEKAPRIAEVNNKFVKIMIVESCMIFIVGIAESEAVIS